MTNLIRFLSLRPFSRWVPDMSEEDGKQLVRDAIRAGIFNDMGSGSNVDLVVIKAKDDVRKFLLIIFKIVQG